LHITFIYGKGMQNILNYIIPKIILTLVAFDYSQ